MEKKEKKSDLEWLLNSLIKKGWKPFGIKSDNIWIYCLSDKKIVISYYDFDTEWECNHEDKWCDLRQLTSKESWLWQFVCENGMVKNANDYSWELYNWEHWQYEVYKNWYEWWKRWEQVDYEYRIIQSALCNEEDLEKFLLDNIKVS
jgi:hypothetical protein